MRRRSIDEIIAECEARGAASCALIVEHIRSIYPELSDREIVAALEGAIERSRQHDLALLREHDARHREEAFTGEELAAIAPDLVEAARRGEPPETT
ncbi:MAG: hypothetical protein ACREE4_22100 [Stellaceae bacterium]